MRTESELTDLQTRLAFQEDALQQLSVALGDQQLQVARLEDTCKLLLDRIRGLQMTIDELTGDESSLERPPHY